MEAGEQIYRAGLSAQSKASQLAANADLYRNAAFAQAQLGHPADALLTLERGKTRLLAEALRLRVPRPEGVPDRVWGAFETAGQALRAAQNEETSLLAAQSDALTSREPAHDPVQAYASRIQWLQAASAALDQAIAQVRRYAPNFLQELSLTTVRSLLPDSQTALVAFCLTEQGSLALVLGYGADTPVRPVELPGVTVRTLRAVLKHKDTDGNAGSWLGTERSRDTARWQAMIEATLASVGAHLLAPVLAALPPAVTKLILLPSGDLYLLPLHAALLPGDGGQRLCDRYEVRYGPSAEVLADAQAKVAGRTGDTLVAVINPAEDSKLAFTSSEGQTIVRLFAAPQVLTGREGREEIVRAAVTGHAYIHFSCHGAYDWNNPPSSGLELAHGERLTLAEL
jgi:CHAT domain-containing protein